MGYGIRRPVLLMGVLTLCGFGTVAAQAVPLPTDLPVWLVGSEAIDGRSLRPYDEVAFAIGRTGKDGPMTPGQRVEAVAIQVLSLRADTRDGRDVWVRSFETMRAGDPTILASGRIVLDRTTLLPLTATLTQGSVTTTQEYDWSTYTVRSSGGQEAVESVDLKVLEAGVHETWVAAIDWSEGTRAMIPTILAGGGGKWWAVPRVVGSDEVDLGDGTRHSAWVIEMDWWGMGDAFESHTPGGGPNGSGGTGGKYWVLKEGLPGLPRVVRVQTEVNAEVDNVVQIQR